MQVKNIMIIEGKILKNLKVEEASSYFYCSVLSGKHKLENGDLINKYTIIKVVYPEADGGKYIRENSFVRVTGQLDSEQFKSQSGKTVFNKIVLANKLEPLFYSRETNSLEECANVQVEEKEE